MSLPYHIPSPHRRRSHGRIHGHPKVALLQRAPDALTDEELLTLLLHAGTGAEEPRTLAARLIGQFGSLGAALSASPEELASVEGMDASRALLLRLVTELHRRYYPPGLFFWQVRLTGTTDFLAISLPFFYGAREELVYLLALDAAGRLLTCTCLGEGSVNSANADAQSRRAAPSANASGVVLAHNHPAGIALPSHEDVELTRRLQQALDVVDILLLDHLVIADDDFAAARQRLPALTDIAACKGELLPYFRLAFHPAACYDKICGI